MKIEKGGTIDKNKREKKWEEKLLYKQKTILF